MEKKNWFDRFASLMEQNIRGVQYGVYCVAGLGFIVAMRSVRPFKKFVVPSDIPKHFLLKRMTFSGKVLAFQPPARVGKNAVILIDHYPVLPLPFRMPTSGLPVEICGINVSSNGGVWIQNLLVGNEVNFTPLRTDPGVVHAVVNNKKQNVGNHLVTIGFATVAPLDFNLKSDPMYSKYYKGLLAAESRAERRGAGVWQDTRPTMFRRILNKLQQTTRLSFLRSPTPAST